ncbi:GNAT family N-acetyltransferase [Curtobacterium sp. VKM Ac-1376]|uniref:GNAT family N-acetyltransferase n=1 Tax=Curtobacterium sp. VKM Ac-1376 TaxID=123312 RepID=UPI00188B6478|nr:GNAT family N-acetyltransferase [Curtobacterium sp. VKM Ac-1376]MBF4612963.1 GNAT family N-acetyltransferase [Curtobacterium sp. VKM Ac-1376]
MLRSGLARGAAPLPFPFVGPLVSDELLVPTLRDFRWWQVRHAVPVARFDVGPGLGDASAALTSAGVEWTTDRTDVVDLTDATPETLVPSMKRGARQALRAAQRNGVEVRPAVPGEVATLLPQVLDESYSSRGVPSPYPGGVGERVERWASGRDDVYAATALVAGEPAGVIVALANQPVVTGWAGGTLRAYRSANPSTVLYHDLLRWSLDRGHTAVDLVGHVDEGISRFKKSLGATEKPYTSVVSSPLPHGARAAALSLVHSPDRLLRSRRVAVAPRVL